MTDFLIKCFVKDRENLNSPAVRGRYAMLSNITGITVNVILFIVKLSVGLLSGSVAVAADAFNNISDAGSNAVTILGFRMASKHADRNHPHGHGRYEYISALAVDIMIIIVGVELFKESLGRIIDPAPTDISPLMLALVGTAAAVKLWMFFFYRKIGNKINSEPIRATALDSISDAATTSAVLLSALIGKLSGIELDGWAGILVACFILFTGFRAVKKTVELLLGAAPDPGLVAQICDFIKQYPEIVGIHDLMLHDYGPSKLILTLHAEVSQDSDLSYAHDIIDTAERDIQERFGCITTIHLDPVALGDERVDKMRRLAEECARQADPSFTIHDFRMANSENTVKLIFDLCIPVDSKYHDDEAAKLVEDCIHRKYPNCQTLIRAEHPFV